MDTNRLRQFCTIVETANLRKAADLLRISHSGLSKSMKVFEHELGFKLFHAHGRGIVVSDEGMELYRRSDAFFRELDRLLGRTEQRSRDLVRIGSFEVFTSHFMGQLVRDHLSETELEIHELLPGRLEEALMLGKIDIGITYEPVPRSGIEYFKIVTVRMNAYARKSHFDGLALEEIPFVTPALPLEGLPSSVRGSDAWPELKQRRQALFRVELMTTGLALAQKGLCAIFIPEFIARLHNEDVAEANQLVPLALPRTFGSVRRDVYIVKRESMAENHVVKKIAKGIRQICG